jgi:hypothetical protein
MTPEGRLLQSFGHTVKLIPPQLVKPYVKRNKKGMRGALVHLAAGGRDGPSPGPLCDDALATDRVRASSRQHPVQHRHADGSLGLLGGEATGSQPGSDQRLVAEHRRFDSLNAIAKMARVRRPDWLGRRSGSQSRRR